MSEDHPAELMIGEATRVEPGYRSPWWLPGGHAQTLWRKLMPAPTLEQQRQRLELDDGDFIDVDHVPADPATLRAWPARQRPLVFLLHGLCGCSRSPYILAMQNLLRRQGYDSVVMNFRGCSGEPNRLAKAYHSGATVDVEDVVGRILQQADGRPLTMVGYSLGANVLVKWLAETALSGHVHSAVSVSNPFDLYHCSREMVSGRVSRFYGAHFLHRLVAELENKKRWFRRRGFMQELEKLEALGDMRSLRNIWQFDDRVTAPLHGFADAEDYYLQCSSDRFLPRVKTPTLVIHGRNDPLIPESSLPPQAQVPDHVEWAVSGGGGHVGFAASGCMNWLERRILRYIETVRLT